MSLCYKFFGKPGTLHEFIREARENGLSHITIERSEHHNRFTGSYSAKITLSTGEGKSTLGWTYKRDGLGPASSSRPRPAGAHNHIWNELWGDMLSLSAYLRKENFTTTLDTRL